jgi:hypothetical protein
MLAGARARDRALNQESGQKFGGRPGVDPRWEGTCLEPSWTGDDQVHARAGALGIVKAAQGRDAEAEALLREAVDRAADVAPGWVHALAVRHLAQFHATRGRADEAAELDAQVEKPVSAG